MRHLDATRAFGVAIAATLVAATFAPADAQTASDAALADLRRLVDDQRRLLEEQARRLDEQARELEAMRTRLDDTSAVALAAQTQLAALTGSAAPAAPLTAQASRATARIRSAHPNCRPRSCPPATFQDRSAFPAPTPRSGSAGRRA